MCARYQYWIKAKEGIWRPMVADNNKAAHSQRSELVKSPNIIAVTPVRPISETDLPMMLKHTIKKGGGKDA